MTHSVTEPAADTIPTNLPTAQPSDAALVGGPNTIMNHAPAMGWPRAKLTPEQVVEIRPKHRSGVTLTQLAKQYGVPNNANPDMGLPLDVFLFAEPDVVVPQLPEPQGPNESDAASLHSWIDSVSS
jgi:hypothetical protein